LGLIARSSFRHQKAAFLPRRAEIFYAIAPPLNFSNRTTQFQEGMEKHKKRGSLMSIPIFSFSKEKRGLKTITRSADNKIDQLHIKGCADRTSFTNMADEQCLQI
jgi:hypothetical protein